MEKGDSHEGRPGDQKGKAKEEPESRPHPAREADQQSGGGTAISNPFLSRLANSASALSSSLLSGAPSNDALASLTAGEKGGSSGSQAASSRAGEAPSLHARPLASGSVPTIRSAHTEAHVAREEAAFADFLDSTGVFVPSESTDLERAWQDSTASTRAQIGAQEPRDQVHGVSSVEAQERRDGQDVVDLLSQHYEEMPDSTEDEGLSPADHLALRNALFGDGRGPGDAVSSIGWDNLLNFIPECLRIGESGRYRADELSNNVREQESSMHLGTADLGESWQLWVDQWSVVLTSYQDEVWGDLESLVRDAKAEVEQLARVEPNEPPPEPKALLRLRNILGHLRGH